MTRDQFTAQQNAVLDDAFALTSDEEQMCARFAALALATYDHLAGAQMFATAFTIMPSDPTFPLRRGDTELLPQPLRQQWIDWAADYPALAERNPRLALRDLMQTIGRTHNTSTWPIGLEAAIDDWIAEPRSTMPFDDRDDIVSPEFYARLRMIRGRAGGMLYFDDRLSRVVFAADAQWVSIKAELDRRADEWNRLVADHAANVARKTVRLAEVIANARRDTAFWSGLKVWELSREGERPVGVSPASGPAGMMPANLSAQERARLDDPPIDPIFVAFVASARRPEDTLSLRDIVLVLRAEMRGELGLDAVFAWPGGPGLGRS